MAKDTDFITTAVGALGAAAMAAEPVMQAVQPGTSMHPQNWIQLGTAVLFGLLGFFTNKKGGTQ